MSVRQLAPLPTGQPEPDLYATGPAAAIVGVAALAAVAFGTALPEQPLPALALVVLVPLAFWAPVASLGVLLFATVVVPFDVQNELAFIGGEGVPGLLLIDLLLLLGLCRVAFLVLSGRLRARAPLLLAVALGLILAAVLVEGVARGADLSEGGHEARRVILGAATFLLAWPILEDPGARRRLYVVLLALGLMLGVWGVAQWLLGVDFATQGDVGVRPGVEETSGGRGQLQGGLYAFPVAATLAFAALLSQRIRSLELRWLLGAILVLNVVSVLLTYERTFWAATALACTLVAFRLGARRTAAVWAAVAIVAVLISLVALGEARTAAERLVSVGGYGSASSYEYRQVESRSVLQAIADRPLTGAGFGATITWGEEGAFATQTTPFSHNGYLWLAWKTGIPVAALIVALIGWAALRRGPAPRDEWLAILRVGCQAALLALLLIGLTFPPFNSLGITAVLGLMAAVCLQRDA